MVGKIKGKYRITVARKVQSIQYESLLVELSAEFDAEDCPLNHAFNEVRAQVKEWVNVELASMGLKRRP
ncbi:hypothetical protein LCGC14_3017580 [marine sediment metagenome]|uniref:Uncharacterized protein n=1 Tax=marine sediment metagenome TaxID=412755 RepID=A0A0F8ZME3_9ZZZZ